MSKNVLITRDKKNSSELVEFLENKGYNCFCEAVFDVHEKQITTNQPISAAIITSSNAISAFLSIKPEKNLKIFCVGSFTAKKLQNLGFFNIFIAPKENAQSLFLEIIKNHKEKEIAHFHGSIFSFDFASELQKHGIKTQSFLSYEIAAKTEISDELKQKITAKTFDIITIFSANSARIFFDLMQKNNLLAYFTGSKLACISDNVKETCLQLDQNNFCEIKTFDQITYLENFYNHENG